jgi:hypothetical protein
MAFGASIPGYDEESKVHRRYDGASLLSIQCVTERLSCDQAFVVTVRVCRVLIDKMKFATRTVKDLEY